MRRWKGEQEAARTSARLLSWFECTQEAHSVTSKNIDEIAFRLLDRRNRLLMLSLEDKFSSFFLLYGNSNLQEIMHLCTGLENYHMKELISTVHKHRDTI